MMLMALGFLAVFVPLQIFLGDLQGLNTREHQPAKLAAIEGRWQTAAPAPLTLFGIPDCRQRMDERSRSLARQVDPDARARWQGSGSQRFPARSVATCSACSSRSA